MYYPSLDQINEILQTGDYDIVPIAKEIIADMVTPIEVMRILKHESEHCFMLESVDDTKRWSRYTFLGFHPKSEITVYDHKMCVDGKTFTVDHPKAYIEELLKQYRSPIIEGMPSFTGGLVGYFAYDYFAYNENTVHLSKKNEEDFMDVDLMLFDTVICFDRDKQKVILITNIKTDHIEENYKKGIQKLDQLHERIIKGEKQAIAPLQLKEEFTPLFSKETFCDMVRKAKHYIREGDIFQVVLSNRLKAKASGSLLDTYRILRTSNPSPYMFYFTSDKQEIAGASPETLVKLEHRRLYTYPLAGTRPRGKTEAEDQKLQYDLLHDEKELAEHHMLVDLGRNDIGKIAKFKSVKLEKDKEILLFSHVMHIGSCVSGELLDDKNAMDVISSLLPAGTLSGAPKIRAAQIIQELEQDRRGIYGGAIGYLDFTGNLDTCIAIRIAYKKQDEVYVRSGAGIVYDSDPEKEYLECLNKAAAVINALKEADGGIDL